MWKHWASQHFCREWGGGTHEPTSLAEELLIVDDFWGMEAQFSSRVGRPRSSGRPYAQECMSTTIWIQSGFFLVWFSGYFWDCNLITFAPSLYFLQTLTYTQPHSIKFIASFFIVTECMYVFVYSYTFLNITWIHIILLVCTFSELTMWHWTSGVLFPGEDLFSHSQLYLKLPIVLYVEVRTLGRLSIKFGVFIGITLVHLCGHVGETSRVYFWY